MDKEIIGNKIKENKGTYTLAIFKNTGIKVILSQSVLPGLQKVKVNNAPSLLRVDYSRSQQERQNFKALASKIATSRN